MQNKREFEIETPLGKLRVYAKHETDTPADYPGVFVDLITPTGESVLLSCTEYDSADGSLLTTAYGDGLIDEPTDIRHHENIFTDEDVEKLWKQFEDVPMNPETECMEADFLHFPAGTSRQDILYWFDDNHSKGLDYLI